jgi:hypothetical protein
VSRARSAQAGPPASLKKFPQTSLSAGAAVYRSVGVDGSGDPWGFGKFSADGDGRFNLADPRGTLYVAITRRGAALEGLGFSYESKPASKSVLVAGTAGIPGTSAAWQHETDQIFIWSLMSTEHTDMIADTHDAHAANFGLTAELTAGSGSGVYTLTKSWANAFDRDGFNGIRYHTRFDTSENGWGYAIFGAAGIHDGQFVSVRAAEKLTDIASAIGIRVIRADAEDAVPTAIVPMPGSGSGRLP